MYRELVAFIAALIFFVGGSSNAIAAKVTVDLGNAKGITMVGAIQRWDSDGNHSKLPDPKAKIDAPAVDAQAADSGHGRWVFKDLPKGTYDLVILADGRRRIEGFQFVPIKEFDPYITPNESVDDETREFIIDDIAHAAHFENIVEPLYLAGNKKAVRVLMMLICDRPTSYEGEFPGAATIRHEVWQYTWQYGGWVKEKRTKVMDRLMLHRDDLHKWTWLWDSKLGGIEVSGKPMTIKYELPKSSPPSELKGLSPH